MANRIIDNVYIIDSQTGVTNALQPGNPSWLSNARIASVKFWCLNTTGVAEFVFASDSQSTAFKLTAPTAPIPIGGATSDMHFGEGVRFSELRCKTLTAGTAWIYFS